MIKRLTSRSHHLHVNGPSVIAAIPALCRLTHKSHGIASSGFEEQEQEGGRSVLWVKIGTGSLMSMTVFSWARLMSRSKLIHDMGLLHARRPKLPTRRDSAIRLGI